MRCLGVLATLLLVTSVLSHPHFGPGYPRFYNEERPLDQPTVNVFKIYAPRLFYMPGYKTNGKKDSNFLNRNKQMISGNENMLDNMLRNEMFPDGLFDEEAANAAFQYENDFVPAPSNIVSRKLPLYAPLSLPPMMGRDYDSPSMHLDDFRPAMGSDSTDFANEGPQFIPDYFNMDDEYCDHHGMFHDMNNPMHQDFSDYPNMRFMDPIFINEDSLPNAGGSGPVTAAIFTPNNASPLTSFFKKFVSEPTKEDKLLSQIMTTVTYGNPELVGDLATIESQLQPEQDEEKDDEEIDIIIAEEITQDTPDETTVEEVERNFVKTILPDNTSVTEEISGNEEKNDDATKTDDDTETQDSDIPVEEVEVNIVKTILPDDSYLVSEAGGENEKIQDEVISMIQNAEGTAQDGSNGNVFISRYLEAPEV